MSPQLRSVTEVGIQNLKRKSAPNTILPLDFFTGTEILKKRFAQLVNATNYQDIAVIPSVSYGIANALRNIPFQQGDEIVVLEEQFPSNLYAWKQLEETQGVRVITISPPDLVTGRAQRWNDRVVDAISSATRAVAIPHIHWADGTLFDLKSIGDRAREVNAYLIIDGTQSVGALPFSVDQFKPDALICGGYKWMLGPYSTGLAYYGARFHEGVPIEDNWKNHKGSADFSNLVNYNFEFQPRAYRYDVGESSNFVLTPMLSEAVQQLLDWTPEAIQDYCKRITEGPLQRLKEVGYFIEESDFRAHHLFGIYLPDTSDMEALKSKILKENIFVSYRGKAIRVSCNVYNTIDDLEKLVSCFI